MLIFNFHHVEPEIRHADRKHISITPDGLRRLIRTLRALGREIVSMRDVLEKADPAENSANQVLITFDDGYVNNLQYAVPVLEEERCAATIFVLPGRFGGTNAWDQTNLPVEERDQLMTLEQMRSLAGSQYVTLGSHGMFHRDLTTLDEQEMACEIQESHRILSEQLPELYVPVFAYPWGNYNVNVLLAMAESPYKYAFTVETAPWRSGQPCFEIPRYSAYYRDGNPFVFLAKLARHRQLLPG